MESMFLDNILMLLIWTAGLCGLFGFLAFITNLFVETWLEKHFPEKD